MEPEFTNEQWAEIDAHIFNCSNLLAVQSIRKFTGMGISEAIVVHVNRYRKLRAEMPSEFKCTDEEYWRETYS